MLKILAIWHAGHGRAGQMIAVVLADLERVTGINGEPHGDVAMAKRRSTSQSGANSFGRRLETLRRHLGYDTAASFARAYGLDPRVYRGFELGKRSRGDDPLVLLRALDQIGVNLTWALTGKERQDKPESDVPIFHRRSKRTARSKAAIRKGSR